MPRPSPAAALLAAATSLLPGAAAPQAAPPAAEWRGTEIPAARTLWSEEVDGGTLELRDYAPHVLAEVRVRGARSGAASTGFRRLAGYIFGGNSGGEDGGDDGGGAKIAMTAPVAQTPGEDGVWTVAFTMPARWSLDALPRAEDPSVTLRQDPGGLRLSLRFAGSWRQDGLGARADALRAEAAARGLAPTGGPSYLFYDGPMTPPFLRRNEVSIPVE